MAIYAISNWLIQIRSTPPNYVLKVIMQTTTIATWKCRMYASPINAHFVGTYDTFCNYLILPLHNHHNSINLYHTSMELHTSDIRWHQRLANLDKALKQLHDDVQTANKRRLSRLERQGLIQSFEFTHELAWNVMKDFFTYQGNPNIRGSRDATREAFKFELIDDGQGWMDMIQSRNLSSHTYNEDIAIEIADKTVEVYFDLFQKFYDKMVSLKNE